MSKDVLLEIGTEEIPAHYMPSVLSQVQQLAADKLNKANIAYEFLKYLSMNKYRKKRSARSRRCWRYRRGWGCKNC